MTDDQFREHMKELRSIAWALYAIGGMLIGIAWKLWGWPTLL
jgi:hypothetical protein